MAPQPPPYSSSNGSSANANASTHSNASSSSSPQTRASARSRERLLRLQIMLYFPFFLLAHTTYCLFGQFLVHRVTHLHHSQAQNRSVALVNLGTIFVTALMAVISTTLGLYGTVLESVPLLTVFWVVSAITALWHFVLIVEFGFAYIAGMLFLLFSIHLSRRYRLLLAERLQRQYQQQQNQQQPNRTVEEPAFTVVSVIPEKA